MDLDKSLAHICISGSGPDRIGHVAKMARTVADAGGSVTHSKMIRLGKTTCCFVMSLSICLNVVT